MEERREVRSFWYKLVSAIALMAVVQYLVCYISYLDAGLPAAGRRMRAENEARTWAWWGAVRPGS